jgi:hypothetical protein
MRKAFAIGLTALLAGAAPPQSVADSATEQATMTIRKGYDRGVGLGRASYQAYFELREGNCKKKKKLADFTWIDKNSKNINITAGNPLTVWAYTDHFTTGYRTLCQSALTFTPEKGRRYELKLVTAVDSGCHFELRDVDTQLSPADATGNPDLLCRKH